jgi:cyclopropane-fatty-acyl-phospholipid synthase
MATRGEHLLRGGKLFASGSGLIGRIFARSFARVLDAIDGRLEVGGIEATTPEGTVRRLGFRAPGPECIVHLKSWYALVRLATSGSIGWYRAWAKREWTSPDPVPLFALFTANARSLGDTARSKGLARLLNLVKHRRRDNNTVKARENIAAHYDLGNDFYAAWLDPTMSYSSARFASDSESLEAAQKRKVARLLDRLDLKPGQRLLEIGCGWGSLAVEAAKRGVSVVGLTLSSEQKKWADARSLKAGVFDRVEIRLADYRDIAEQFDAIASVEMVEAVGERWWGAYLDCIARNLKPAGRAALQYISIEHDLFENYARNPDFIQAYIFPGGMLLDEPRFEALAKARGLSWEDRDGFGLDYARTLKIWRDNYDAALASRELEGFSGDFHDLWRYYLMYCEGGFRGGAIDVAQVTMVKS